MLIKTYKAGKQDNDQMICTYLLCYTGGQPNFPPCLTGGNGFKGKLDNNGFIYKNFKLILPLRSGSSWLV